MLTTPQRIGLAKLITSVNAWEKSNNAYTALKNIADSDVVEAKKKVDEMTTSLARQVRSFGVSFKEGAGDEAAAAIAVLLFGNSAAELPGGYVGAELDERSPIAQVLEFPQEFVLLGRATVMIKGIAKRLDMEWSLSDRWGAVAQEAADAETTEQMPIWSVLKPQVQMTNDVGRPDSRIIATRDRPRFADVKQALANTMGIAIHYFKIKITMILKKTLPASVQTWLAKTYLRLHNCLS